MADLLSNKYKQIPIELIDIDRQNRQRKEITTDDLIDSIRQNGILVPLILEEVGERYNLIAGERRLTAAKQIPLKTVPARLAKDLTEKERQLVELEENAKRKELPWLEQVTAVSKIHKLFLAEDPTWTAEKTANYLCFTSGYISKCLQIIREVEAGNQQIAKVTKLSEAMTATKRAVERKNDAIVTDLLEAVVAPKEIKLETAAKIAPTVAPVAAESPIRILNADAIKWMDEYSGPLFNLFHFDLPYGVELSEQAGLHNKEDGYSGNNYEQLCEAIKRNWHKLAAPSCHVLFWFPMKLYGYFKDFLEDLGLTVDPNCYIWNKHPIGIIRNALLYPRNVYEPCFIAFRGNRPLVKGSVNLVSYTPDKTKLIHGSEKPQQVMRHLLSMFVDEHTKMFDPTCGSGSALRAAEFIYPNLPLAIGLEENQAFAKSASDLLIRERKMAEMSRKLEQKQ